MSPPDLGIHPEALRKRVRQAEPDAGERGDRLTSSERERLRELERKVKQLRRANEILKAAGAYFARELDPTDRSERVHRRASRALRGRAELRDVGRVGVPLTISARAACCARASWLTSGCLVEIRRVHRENYECYGSRRVWKQLLREGSEAARCTVERLMAEHGIQGAKRRVKPRRRGARPAQIRRAATRRISSSETSPPRLPTGCGSRTSPTCARGRVCCSSRL